MARLAAIQRDYGTVVGQTAPAALPVDINGRRLYRARFVGLDLARARSTCQRLTQMGVTCLVMR